MGLYLYCIGGADHPSPAGIAGIDGAAVLARDVAGLRTWLSEHDAAPAASLERVRSHNAVVEAADQAATPLPLRFGQWFATADELEARLRDRRAELERGLARVAGAREFGVRITDPAPQPVPADRSTGRAYLETLARRERDAEAARDRGFAVADALLAWLGSHIREQRVRPLGSPGGLAAVAHLVDRHDIGRYRTRLRDFSDQVPELRLVFSGPWPPYGFVDDG